MGNYFQTESLITMSKKAAPAPAGKQFDPKFWERPGLSADEVQEVKDAFDLFDTDLSGAVSVQELIEAMQSLGLEQKNEAVFNMIKEIDTDGSGELEFQEFLEMMTARLSDNDRTGEISLDNLKRVNAELGEEVSNEELQEMVTRNDVDKDGAWTLDDFYAVMTKKGY